MSTKIAIIGHWHTGTTLVAKTLRACGMEVGNVNTYWDADCKEQCEHSRLNSVGDKMCLNQISDEQAENKIRTILESYITESEANDWECFGVKITHATYKETWPIYYKLFKEVWPDVVFIKCTRSLAGIITSTRDDKWPIDRIIESYCDQVNDTTDFTLQYPNDYPHKLIEIVKRFGLSWKWSDRLGLFDPSRVRVFDEGEINDIYHRGGATLTSR